MIKVQLLKRQGSSLSILTLQGVKEIASVALVLATIGVRIAS